MKSRTVPSPPLPSWSRAKPYVKVALWLTLALVPMIIGLTWGTYLNDEAYVTLRYARNLALGRGPTYGARTLSRSPLYVLALWPLAKLGAPLASLILSTLGWSAAALAIYSTGHVLRRPIAAIMAAVLTAFCPAITTTLGMEIPWAIALAWLTLVAAIKGRWKAQACALALMLLAHFDLLTLALALLMVAAQWIARRRFPLLPVLILALVALGCGLLAAWQVIALPCPPRVNLAGWGDSIQRLLNESEFYGLFVPLCLCGTMELVSTTRKAWGHGVLWGAVAILTSGPAAEVMVITMGLLLTGLGVQWIIQWIKARNLTRLDHITLAAGVMLLAGLPLGIAQASSLAQRYQARLVAHHAVEQQAGDWLRDHSEPTATVFGSERLGYLADRATFPWHKHEHDRDELALLLKTLSENPPEYLVSSRGIYWDQITQTRRFQEIYMILESFRSPYDVSSPIAIWGRRAEAVSVETSRPLNIHLPGGVDLIGYVCQPERVQPGDTVRVVLFLQPTRPVTESLRPIVQMSIPQDTGDWQHWWQVNTDGNYGIPMDWWLPGEIITQQFWLTMDKDMPVGAYRLDALVLSTDAKSFLPMYQDGDTAPIDRVLLGYVAIPWTGEAREAAIARAKPVDARFGEHINLLGFEAQDSAAAGAELEVTLYWGAQLLPRDDYVVFVHLTDDADQPIASHDGPPMEGRYPTRAWFPGDVVPDSHRLLLDPATPAGTYRLQVGLYQWPSLERLPVCDGDGVEQVDRSLFLGRVEVTTPSSH
jgi:hypothetical protein